MEFGLFLGCNTPAIRPDVERAIRATMPEVGVALQDIEGYVCCPAFGSFPSTEDDSHYAVSGWNLSLAEAKGLDLVVQCGSCYSSLRMGQEHLRHDRQRLERVNELLEPAGRSVKCTCSVRHITDVLYHDVGTEKIVQSVVKGLDGVHGIVQYPCHTLFPSETVGFDVSARRPKILRELVEALGATVDEYSREYECCGGAGGFYRNSAAQAKEYARVRFEAVVKETKAQFIAVSCITCLMFLDNIQQELIADGSLQTALPVYDYNQLLALCMGFDPQQVACLGQTPQDQLPFTDRQ